MKKSRSMPFILLGCIAVAAVAIGGYRLYAERGGPPELPAYTDVSDLRSEIQRLEGLRRERGLSWRDTYRLGVAYLHAGRLEEAVATLEEAADMRPAYHRILESLGMAYYRLDRLEDAASAWQRALDTGQAPHIEEMVKRTRTKIALERRIAVLEELVKGEDVDWRIRYELAALYLGLNRPRDAVTQLEEAVSHKKDDPGIYDTLARAYALTGDYESAVRAEEKALSLKPDADIFKKRLEEMRRLRDALESGGFHAEAKRSGGPS